MIYVHEYRTVEFTGDRWTPRTNGQLRGKCFHLMTSSRKEAFENVCSMATILFWPQSAKRTERQYQSLVLRIPLMKDNFAGPRAANVSMSLLLDT